MDGQRQQQQQQQARASRRASRGSVHAPSFLQSQPLAVPEGQDEDQEEAEESPPLPLPPPPSPPARGRPSMFLPSIQEMGSEMSIGGSLADQSSSSSSSSNSSASVGQGSISIDIPATPPPVAGASAASTPSPPPPGDGAATAAGDESSGGPDSIAKTKLAGALRQARRKMITAGMVGALREAAAATTPATPSDGPLLADTTSGSASVPVFTPVLAGAEEASNPATGSSTAAPLNSSSTHASGSAAPVPSPPQPPLPVSASTAAAATPASAPPPPTSTTPASSPPRIMSKASTFAKIAKLAMVNANANGGTLVLPGPAAPSGGGGGELSPPSSPIAASPVREEVLPRPSSPPPVVGTAPGAGASAVAAARRQSRLGSPASAAGGAVSGVGGGKGLGAGNVRASFHEAAAAARRTSMVVGGDPARRRQSTALNNAGPAAAARGAASALPAPPPAPASAASSVLKQKFTVTDDIVRQIKNSRRSKRSSWSPVAWQKSMGGSSRSAIMDTEGLVNAYVELVCEDLKTSEKKNADSAQEQRSRWIIDPGASWRNKWDLLMLFLVIWTSYSVPFKAAFSMQLTLSDMLIDSVVDVLFLADVVLNCLTAYYEDDGSLQTSVGAIVQRYAKGWMLVDLVSTVPASFDSGSDTVNRLLLGLKFVKLVRLGRFMRYMDSKEVAMFFTPSMLRLVNTFVIMTWVCHVMACVYWYISTSQGLGSTDWTAKPDFADNPVLLNYFLCLTWSLQTTFAIESASGSPETSAEAWCTITCFTLGIFMNAYVIGSAGSALQSLDQDKEERRQLLDRIITYMNKRKLPPYFQRIILDFYNYMSEKRSEENVLTGLPPAIQLRLALLLNRELVKNIPLVKQLELNTIVGLMQTLQSTMYMPGEYVFKAGEKGDNLYFVKNGRLEVLLLDHVNAVSLLQKGEMFGQVALTTDGVHEFNVRAAVYSEVLSLNRDAYEALAAESEKFMELVEMEAIKQEQFIVKAQKNMKRMAKMVGLATGATGKGNSPGGRGGNGGGGGSSSKRRGGDEDEDQGDGGGRGGRGDGGGGGGSGGGGAEQGAEETRRQSVRASVKKVQMVSRVVSMFAAAKKGEGSGSAKVVPADD